MKIFAAAAADYASWASLMGVKPGDAKVTGYVAARYVQSGGISANFKIHSTLADGPEDYTLVCPANEDDTKSLIRKLPNTKTGDDLPNPKLGLIEISLEA